MNRLLKRIFFLVSALMFLAVSNCRTYNGIVKANDGKIYVTSILSLPFYQSRDILSCQDKGTELECKKLEIIKN